MTNKSPINKSGCCLPNVDGITYLKIGDKEHVIGMMNLESGFQQLFSCDRKLEDITDEELVRIARQHNYIPNKPSIEADYAVALRRAYLSFLIENKLIEDEI